MAFKESKANIYIDGKLVLEDVEYEMSILQERDRKGDGVQSNSEDLCLLGERAHGTPTGTKK